MQIRSNIRPVVIWALVALALGLAGGFYLGFEVASRFWVRMSQPTFVSAGNQAHNVLRLLDRGEEGKLRRMLEMEIESTLLYLHTLETKGELDPNSSASTVYARLKRYRDEHPWKPTPSPPGPGKEPTQ
jgi:hypothetical protein